MDAIARSNEPTQSQLDALESSYHGTGDYLSSCPEFAGYLHEIHAHGSRQLGTIVRPITADREGFDIDLIARLKPTALRKYEGASGPAQLLEHLFLALKRYANAHGLLLHRWERCVTLEYAGGMCADIAPVIDSPYMTMKYGETHGLIPDQQLSRYESTNPRGYSKYFDQIAAISPVFTAELRFAEAMDSVIKAEVTPLPNAQEVFDRLLCRLIQLMKLHRNVAFGIGRNGVDLAPSSVFVTTLAAMAYEAVAPLPHESPLALLLDIVECMPKYFQRIQLPSGSQKWVLPNPSAPNDNLAEGMNDPAKQAAFFQWHQRLIEDLARILDNIENHAGMDTLVKSVEAAFGRKASNAIQQDQSQRRESSRIAGKVALITSSVAAPISVKARTHTYFGG